VKPLSSPTPVSDELKAKLKEGVVTVAADGSGDFQTVQDALNAAPDEPQGSKPFLINIKPGIYKEAVSVPLQKGAVDLRGEDAATTKITFANAYFTPDANGKPLGTFKTATLFVPGDDFSAENITVENSFGKGAQALALRMDGDRAIFRKCRFVGWQDTILALRGRQYFEDCNVTGAVDFIFGAATALFQRCEIHCLSSGYITAASTPQGQPYGFVFANCTITAEPGVQTYLGRPWRPYASVTFLNTQMPDAIVPPGWHNWNNTDNQATARYAEWHSTGPGAPTPARVPWARQLTDAQARAMTLPQILGGWVPGGAPGLLEKLQ
jgi:pectinesterase